MRLGPTGNDQKNFLWSTPSGVGPARTLLSMALVSLAVQGAPNSSEAPAPKRTKARFLRTCINHFPARLVRSTGPILRRHYRRTTPRGRFGQVSMRGSRFVMRSRRGRVPRCGRYRVK